MTKPAKPLNRGTVPSRNTRWLRTTVRDLFTLVKQGIVRPMRPDKLLRIFLAWRHWGLSLAFGYSVGAIRHPDRPALIDERGALSFADIAARTTRLGHGLRDQGIGSGDRVGVLCRNHHGLVETILACTKIGADVVLINTGLDTRQLDTVLREQNVRLLVCDEEFAQHRTEIPIVLGWTEGPTREPTVEHLVASSPATPLPRVSRRAGMIVLTSGTTGTPRGIRRPEPAGLGPAATMMSRIPLRSGERILVGSPAFHTWGLAALQLGTVLGATLVLRREFDPRAGLAALSRHRCTAMFTVPISLQRIMELPAEVRASFDLAPLRIVASSGAALPPDLANRFLRGFGPVLYNVYGSTEASWVSIATPTDLRHAPNTAGRPPRGTTLRILDRHGNAVPTGRTGGIFAANDMLFQGYTDGKPGREVRDGLMSTGDLGRVDRAGRLFVVGRADDVIVSGGENVYPQRVEHALLTLPEVIEAAVIGVEDAELGQRVAAFVVPKDDASLDGESVRERIRGDLPSFAVPRDVLVLDELPRDAVGVVLTSELRHHIARS